MKLDTNSQAFLNHVIKDCKENNIKFKFSKKSHVKLSEGSYCSGYFCEEDRELVVTTKPSQEEWLRLIVHEWNHMQQWKEQCPEWKADDVNEIFDWYCGDVELHPKTAWKYSMTALNLELDCEKRSVETIILFDLPLDIQEYTRRANAYVMFYHAAYKNRSWSRKFREPYNIPEIVNAMSPEFDMDYTRLPAKFEKLYMNCF